MTKDIEIPDNEDAACDLDKIESYCAIRGLYDQAEKASGSARRLRADAEKIARLTAECEALRADVVWAVEKLAWSENPPHKFIDCDATPADILRAVKEARNGVS